MDCNEDDNSISDDDIVLRRVYKNFTVYDDNRSMYRPSSQAFKQNGPDGPVSVYLASETCPAAVADEGQEEYLVSIKVRILRELGLGLIRNPCSGGQGHCEILGRKTRSTLRKIVDACEWVEGYAPEQ